MQATAVASRYLGTATTTSTATIPPMRQTVSILVAVATSSAAITTVASPMPGGVTSTTTVGICRTRGIVTIPPRLILASRPARRGRSPAVTDTASRPLGSATATTTAATTATNRAARRRVRVLTTSSPVAAEGAFRCGGTAIPTTTVAITLTKKTALTLISPSHLSILSRPVRGPTLLALMARIVCQCRGSAITWTIVTMVPMNTTVVRSGLFLALPSASLPCPSPLPLPSPPPVEEYKVDIM